MTPRPRTVGSLFAGIGGLDLGFERAGYRTRWTAELEPFAAGILRRRLPRAAPFGDVVELADHAPPADVYVGGFPCQDLSDMGRRAGLHGDRSGLWTAYARAIEAAKPAAVVVENVPALLRRGFEVVVADLVELGYTVEWDCLPAAAYGAPHLRDRLFVVAHHHDRDAVFGAAASLFPVPPAEPDANGWRRYPRAGLVQSDPLEIFPLEPTEPLDRYRALTLWPTPKSSPSGPDYARANRDRSGGDDLATAVARETPGQLNPDWVEWLMGFPIGWTDPTVEHPDPRGWNEHRYRGTNLHRRNDDGLGIPRVTRDTPLRRERLTALGNAVVPQVAEDVARRLGAILPPPRRDGDHHTTTVEAAAANARLHP